MKKGFLTLLVIILLTAVAVQYAPRQAAGPGKGRHLKRVLPDQLPGWSGQDMPLGNTEALAGSVEKTLQYDDVYFREFTSGGHTLSLYVAYWGPAKMPTQLVASHTPDRCWVENGWSCDQVAHGVTPVGSSASLLPGEWRIFSAPGGQKLMVLFWHQVGNELYDYGDRTNRMPSMWRWWRDATQHILRSPPEQYFVRVSSDVPFEQLRGDPGWEQMLAALGRIGLGQREPRRRAVP